MKHYRMMPGNQRGLTFWGLLFLLIVFGFFGLFGFRTLPAYLNEMSVERDVGEVARSGDFDPNNPAAITRLLEKRWDIDYINDLDFKDIKVEKLPGGPALTYDYEVRKHLFLNIDVVMEFKKVFPLSQSVG